MIKFNFLSGLIVLLTLIGLALPTAVLASDLRAQEIQIYLEKHGSPLAGEARVFVEEADKNHLDYRLVAAIAGVESTFAKQYVFGTYNAWGWGGT